MNDKLQNTLIGTGITLAVIIVSLIIFRIGFVTFVESWELGYSFDKFEGKITVLPRTGYFVVLPWKTSIHSIDTRPMQVRIEANNRVLNAKLVRFRPEGLSQFLELHGRGDYKRSTASSDGGTKSGLDDILKSYAYENYGSTGYSEEELEKKYKFLDIMSGTNTFPQGNKTDIINTSDSLKTVVSK